MSTAKIWGSINSAILNAPLDHGPAIVGEVNNQIIVTVPIIKPLPAGWYFKNSKQISCIALTAIADSAGRPIK